MPTGSTFLDRSTMNENVNEQMVVIRRKCVICQQPSQVIVPQEVMRKLNEGMFVQQAWPEGSADERETLISGSHPACYDTLTAQVDDEEQVP